METCTASPGRPGTATGRWDSNSRQNTTRIRLTLPSFNSAGTGFIEYIDARDEPVGWKLAGFQPSADWGPVVASAPTTAQLGQLHAKMEPPMQVGG